MTFNMNVTTFVAVVHRRATMMDLPALPCHLVSEAENR